MCVYACVRAEPGADILCYEVLGPLGGPVLLDLSPGLWPLGPLVLMALSRRSGSGDLDLRAFRVRRNGILPGRVRDHFEKERFAYIC